MTKVHSYAYMTALEGLGGKCILATVTGRGVEDLSEETPFQISRFHHRSSNTTNPHVDSDAKRVRQEILHDCSQPLK
jgi:hypothetical protein